MKYQDPNYSNSKSTLLGKSDSHQDKVSKRSIKENWALITLVITVSVLMFVNAVVIMMDSNTSFSIDFENCYSELILTAIILLAFLKSYRVNTVCT